MKLLLTGSPRIGKSTLLFHVLQSVANKNGFITQEICDHTQRIGFKLLSSNGEAATFAHVDFETNYKVSRYFVDLNSLDLFIEPLFEYGADQLLYIDEIGQMQVLSTQFRKLVENYLNAKNDFIATLTSAYTDEFIDKIKSLGSVTIIELTLENRKNVEEILQIITSSLDKVKKLSPPQQQLFERLMKIYINKGQYIQLKKLFNNALIYILEDKVIKIHPNVYMVKGNNCDHRVIKETTNWECDCDLFTGKGEFINQQRECSHIQSVKLFLI